MELMIAPNDKSPSHEQIYELVVWNCRGGNGADFIRNFRALLDQHRPLLVALLETKLQSHQGLIDDFPFNQMIEIPKIGNSGGLVVLWDNNMLELDEIATTKQEIHAMIKVSVSNDQCLVSSIYASNFRSTHTILQENIHTTKNNYNSKWLIGGFY